MPACWKKNKAVGTINEGAASALLLPAIDVASDLTDADHKTSNQHTEPHSDSVPTVEDELVRHQRQSADLAVSLAAEPDNSALQEQLKESLVQIRQDAALLDNTEATDRAQAAIDILERPDFSTSQSTLADIVTATAQVPAAAEVVAAVVTPATEEAVDAELLEIFMMEAEEVLAFVKQTLPQSRGDISNQEHLTTLRRSFHTLKGSGRMVGLNTFADAAGSIEQVMNLWLSEARAGTPDLYALLDKTQEQLSAWVCEINLNGNSSRSASALKSAAERVKQGQPFHFDEVEPAPVAAVASLVNDLDQQSRPRLESQIAVPVEPAADPRAEVHADLDQQDFGVADEHIELAGSESLELVEPIEPIDYLIELIEPVELNEPIESIESIESIEAQSALMTESAPADNGVQTIGQPESAMQADHAAAHDGIDDDSDIVSISDFVLSEEPEPLPPVAIESVAASEPLMEAEVIDFPGHLPPHAKPDDSIKQIGELEISVPLYNIYLAETDEIVRRLAQDFAEWRHEPHRPVSTQAVHAAHSLGGSSATVGFQSLQQVAHGLEMMLQSLTRRHVNLHSDEYDKLDQCVERLKLMLQKNLQSVKCPRTNRNWCVNWPSCRTMSSRVRRSRRCQRCMRTWTPLISRR
ncbi:Hpt domain-containing protein [Undibacterium arcticum]